MARRDRCATETELLLSVSEAIENLSEGTDGIDTGLPELENLTDRV